MSLNSFLRVCVSLLILGVFTTGCTAVSVNAVAAVHRIDHIRIENNPRVTISDFVSVMQEGFQAHGISSQVVAKPEQPSCVYSATYTARRSWDFATYLSEAQIDILREGRNIASANYHLRGKGGFALTKFEGTRAKILPVIDQLLAQVTHGDRVVSSGAKAPAASEKVSLSNAAPSSELSKKLAELKDAYDAQLISLEEYESKRKSLIEAM